MLGYLAYTPPLAVFWLVLIIVNYAGIALGVALRRPWAWNLANPTPRRSTSWRE